MQRDGKGQEDGSASASAGELSAEVTVLQEGGSALESKVQPSFFDPFLLTPLSAAGTKTNPRERCYFNIYTFSGTFNASWCLLYPPYQFFFIVHLPPTFISLYMFSVSLCAHQQCAAAPRLDVRLPLFFFFFLLLSHGVELSAVPQ